MLTGGELPDLSQGSGALALGGAPKGRRALANRTSRRLILPLEIAAKWLEQERELAPQLRGPLQVLLAFGTFLANSSASRARARYNSALSRASSAASASKSIPDRSPSIPVLVQR